VINFTFFSKSKFLALNEEYSADSVLTVIKLAHVVNSRPCKNRL